MSEHEGRRGFVGRIVDGVEDAVEDAVTAVGRAADVVEDTVERAVHSRGGHEHHHPSGQHTRPGEHVTVTVNVSCCPCPPGGAGGHPGGGRPGGRPGHSTGTTDGTVGGGLGDIGGVIGVTTRPPTIWPGTRTQLYLPYLFIRATAGDTGARPVSGVFWESPDILVLPGVAPANAPRVPADLGGTAQAGADNTLYAHIWNLGQAPVGDVLVEFYWFNPSLGFTGSSAHLIGVTWTDLAARGNAGSHRLVKCPVSWSAQYVNGGHECLMVRLSQPVTDPLSAPPWDAARNRHIGQRNIHVMSAEEAAAKPTIAVEVGPLFGGAAQVGVARAETATMPWLHLVTMSRTTTFDTANPTGDVGITAPVPAGTGVPDLGGVPDPRAAGLIGDSHGVSADGQQIAVHATDSPPGPGDAHVYRITGSQDGSTFGGYTVVVLGERH
jgi:hypothetical protein